MTVRLVLKRSLRGIVELEVTVHCVYSLGFGDVPVRDLTVGPGIPVALDVSNLPDRSDRDIEDGCDPIL